MEEKILTRLTELRAEEGDSPAALCFAAERSVELMKAYCNLETLPEELLGAGVTLAGWLLESGAAATPSHQAKSIREGDVSISFRENGAETGKMPAHLRTELDRFRRLGW